MKQVEITRYLLESEESAFDKLEKQGFKLIRTSTIEDRYSIYSQKFSIIEIFEY